MCHYICENCLYEISFSKLSSFNFQVLELVSCNCKQCDDNCLCSSRGLTCSWKSCKNSNEEPDEKEYFDNCSESKNDSESDAEY